MMPIPWTLQKYIFREMSKTFLLTSAAMTVTLSLGGGVLNMIKLGEVTPGQLLSLMGLVIPVAIALTLPVAALFSATSTYGRLSADNEFVACRSSGINLHVLFLPTVVLSLLSASVTFGFTNWLIPGMVRNLNQFVNADFGTLIQQRLSRPGGINLANLRLNADESIVDPDDPNRIMLNRVTFVEMDGEEWDKFGTAHSVILQFQKKKGRVLIQADMNGLTYYDRPKGQFANLGHQRIPPNELPNLVPQKIKFLTLFELFHYLRNPEQWREVQESVEKLRAYVGVKTVYDSLEKQWVDQKHVIMLADDSTRWVIRSESAARIPRDGGIEFYNAKIEETKGGRLKIVHSPKVVLEIQREDDLTQCLIQLEAEDCKIVIDQQSYERMKTTLGPIELPPDLIESVINMPNEKLMTAFDHITGDDPLAEKRKKVIELRGHIVRKIASTISERAAFSASVFVLVILGAVLGIVYRGSQAIIAFGISFIPALVAIITIVMGKQLAQNVSTHMLGFFVMWAGIAVVAGLDYWTLTKVLRR